MIQSAIGLDRGFHGASGTSASTPGPPEFDGAFSNDAADSPDGNTIPAFRAACSSRLTSASEGAPEATWNLPSASTASDDASIRATTPRGCADTGPELAPTFVCVCLAAVRLDILASPQPAVPAQAITRSR